MTKIKFIDRFDWYKDSIDYSVNLGFFHSLTMKKKIAVKNHPQKQTFEKKLKEHLKFQK